MRWRVRGENSKWTEEKDALFEALDRQLHLPSYFGMNWDALDECLRDFHWIQTRRIVIVHLDLPALDVKDLVIYLGILDDSVAYWRSDPEHEIVVVFPSSSREKIRWILSNARSENSP